MSEKQSRFATVVPTVEKFPLAIIIVGSLLLLINIFFFFTSLFNVEMIFPGLSASGIAPKVQYIFASRQLGIALVFALALYGKNTRFMQLAWFLAFLRELGDFAGMLAIGDTAAALSFTPMLVFELGAFIYVGAIASGHVAKYKPQV